MELFAGWVIHSILTSNEAGSYISLFVGLLVFSYFASSVPKGCKVGYAFKDCSTHLFNNESKIAQCTCYFPDQCVYD